MSEKSADCLIVKTEKNIITSFKHGIQPTSRGEQLVVEFSTKMRTRRQRKLEAMKI